MSKCHSGTILDFLHSSLTLIERLSVHQNQFLRIRIGKVFQKNPFSLEGFLRTDPGKCGTVPHQGPGGPGAALCQHC